MKTVFVRIPENTPECDLRTTVRDAAFDDLNFCGFECSHMPQWEECENVWIAENWMKEKIENVLIIFIIIFIIFIGPLLAHNIVWKFTI